MTIILYIIFLFYILYFVYNLNQKTIYQTFDNLLIKILLIIMIIINILVYYKYIDFNLVVKLDIILTLILYFYIKKIHNLLDNKKNKLIHNKLSKQDLINIKYHINIITYILILNIICIIINQFY